MENEKTANEFSEVIKRWLENTKEYFKPLSTDEIKNLCVIETIINYRIIEIRDELISIRTLLDETPTKGKQKLTNLIKEMK